jgi:hypothetical protein
LKKSVLNHHLLPYIDFFFQFFIFFVLFLITSITDFLYNKFYWKIRKNLFFKKHVKLKCDPKQQFTQINGFQSNRLTLSLKLFTTLLVSELLTHFRLLTAIESEKNGLGLKIYPWVTFSAWKWPSNIQHMQIFGLQNFRGIKFELPKYLNIISKCA